jgi:hypothetical protein
VPSKLVKAAMDGWGRSGQGMVKGISSVAESVKKESILPAKGRVYGSIVDASDYRVRSRIVRIRRLSKDLISSVHSESQSIQPSVSSKKSYYRKNYRKKSSASSKSLKKQ